MLVLTRRYLLSAFLFAAASLGVAVSPGAAFGQTPDQAVAFVDQSGKELIGVVNGSGTPAEKQERLRQIVDRVVDVDSVARFCLGRFWRGVAPAQQQEYLKLFHQVLLKNITSKLGDYTGVTFAVGRATPGDGTVSVATIVTRPNSAPANVEWIVSFSSGAPRIVDVIAEGTSLRLTQRSDYASYLSQNNNNVAALLDAMQKQLQRPS